MFQLHFISIFFFLYFSLITGSSTIIINKKQQYQKGIFSKKKTSSRINDKIINTDIPDDDIVTQELNGSSFVDLK